MDPSNASDQTRNTFSTTRMCVWEFTPPFERNTFSTTRMCVQTRNTFSTTRMCVRDFTPPFERRMCVQDFTPPMRCKVKSGDIQVRLLLLHIEHLHIERLHIERLHIEHLHIAQEIPAFNLSRPTKCRASTARKRLFSLPLWPLLQPLLRILRATVRSPSCTLIRWSTLRWT